MAERLSAEGLRATLGATESGKFEVVPNGFGGTTTRRVEKAPAFRKGPQATAEAPKLAPATQGQKTLLREMLAERAGVAEAEEIRATINAAREANALTFPVASAAITALKLVPRPAAAAPAFKPRPNQYAGRCEECGTRVEAGEGILTKSDEGKWEVAHAEGGCPVSEFPFPFGSYAIEGVDGVVKFYVASTEGLFAQASDTLFPVFPGSQAGIIAAIAGDPEEASRRYGREIGKCGRCGRTLTDEESRAEGIGPVCAKKAWA